MSYQKLAVLAEKLYQKTVAGKIDWEQTASKNTYQAAFSNYTVLVFTQQSRENYDDVDYVISVFNEDGSKIEEFSDVDLSDMGAPLSGESYYQLMKETFEVARRHSLGTEKAINEILELLDDSEVPS